MSTRIAPAASVSENLRRFWRSLSMAAWLGWQIESNWTDPLLFGIYSLVKPLAGALILVVMYSVITGGDFDSPMFTYMYLGNAFYILVGRIMNGLAWAVMDDREHYKTLKYIYLAPIHFPSYLFGRGVANFMVGLLSVVITIAFGMLFLHLQVSLAAVNWPLLLLTLFVGAVMLAFMGLILAGFMLLAAHHMWGVGEAVAGALYLFSGAIFPLQTLPPWLRWIGYLMPITYWLELLRRAMIGPVADSYPTLPSLTNAMLMAILVGLSILYAVLAVFSFRRCEQTARERGVIDVVTNY